MALLTRHHAYPPEGQGGLAPVVEALKKERTRLEGQHGTALITVDHLEAEIRKVEGAIAALLGEKQPRKKPGRKRGLNGAQVTALVERVLAHEGPLKEPDLKEKVNQRAEDEGQSKLGLALVLSKVLKSGAFEFNGAKWQLRNGRVRGQ